MMTQGTFCLTIIHAVGLFHFSLFNTVPFYSLKHNSQRLNRSDRGLVLVASW